jgi:hypothetical protein
MRNTNCDVPLATLIASVATLIGIYIGMLLR